MPADWDDDAVWAFARCCCNHTAVPEGLSPPTIQFRTDPFTGLNSTWTINTPIASEQYVAGQWADADNPKFDPVLGVLGIQSIEIFFGSDDNRTGQGDIIIANQATGPSGTWSYATSGNHIKLSDVGKTVRAVITDADGLKGTAAATLRIPYEDLVEEAQDHPAQKQQDWTGVEGWDWYSPYAIFAADGAHSGVTFVQNAPTGWGGGILIPVTGIYADLYATQQTAGQWRAHLQLLMAPDQPDVHTYVQIDVYVGTPTEITLGTADLRYTMRHPAGATGYTESSFVDQYGDTVSDQVNIILSDYDGSGTPFSIADGEACRILLTAGATDDNGNETFFIPAGSEPFLTFMHMEHVSNLPAPPSETPGKVFWSWFDSLIPKATWDAYIAQLPTGSEGRPQGTNLSNGRLTFTSDAPYGTLHQIQVGAGHEAPTMDAGGNLICDRSFVPKQSDHSQVVPRGNYDAFESGFYLKPKRTYRVKWTMTLAEPTDRAFWEIANQWKVLFEMHCGDWGPAWINPSSRQAIIAWQIYNGEMYIVTRGTNEQVPTQYLFPNESHPRQPLPQLGVPHRFKMEFRVDPLGPSSFCKAWFNDIQICDIFSTAIGINWSASSTPGAAFPLAGAYTPQDGIITHLHSWEFSEI